MKSAFVCGFPSRKAILAIAGLLLATIMPSHSTAAGVIDLFPGANELGGGYGPIGEIDRDNPYWSIDSGNSFANYFGQPFIALPGLASKLTIRLNSFGFPSLDGPDGLDFKILLAEMTNGIPTNVVAETPLTTFGPALGGAGIPAIGYLSPDYGPLLEFDFGGVDLIDGAEYAWIIDTVSGADGLNGVALIASRRALRVEEPNVRDGVVYLQFDLDRQAGAEPWITTTPNVYLAFSLTFADGGTAALTHDIIRVLPTVTVMVPEPATLALLGLGLAGLGFSRRKQ